jgi:hypothetical protein
MSFTEESSRNYNAQKFKLLQAPESVMEQAAKFMVFNLQPPHFQQFAPLFALFWCLVFGVWCFPRVWCLVFISKRLVPASIGA